MEPSDPLYPFLLTLSYWEKSTEELEKWKEVRRIRRVDSTQYDSVLGSYSNHRRQAHAYLREVRWDAAQALPEEERELEELVLRLRKLGRDASKGRIKPDKANAESARIQAQLAPLQDSVVLRQTIVQVESTNQIGGRLVMPLDEYGVKIRRLGLHAAPNRAPRAQKEARRSPAPLYAVLFVLVAVAVIVFYPMLNVVGVNMRFTAQHVGNQVIFACINRGDAATFFYAPWPDGNPDPQGLSPKGRSFGVRIYVREPSMEDWHLLPASEGAWYQQQSRLMEPGPYTIEAGASKVFQLDLAALRSVGLDADATLVQIVSGRGKVLRELTVE